MNKFPQDPQLLNLRREIDDSKNAYIENLKAQFDAYGAATSLTKSEIEEMESLASKISKVDPNKSSGLQITLRQARKKIESVNINIPPKTTNTTPKNNNKTNNRKIPKKNLLLIKLTKAELPAVELFKNGKYQDCINFLENIVTSQRGLFVHALAMIYLAELTGNNDISYKADEILEDLKANEKQLKSNLDLHSPKIRSKIRKSWKKRN